MIVTLLILLSISFAADWNGIYSSEPTSPIISLEDVSESTTTIKLSLDGYYSNIIDLNETTATKIFIDGGASILKEGFPDLPSISRSLIIPDESNMSIRGIDQEYIEIENIDIIPSKGNLSRDIDPSSIDYTWSAIYNKNSFYPHSLAYLRDPYILRDHRGQTIVFSPFQYNPISKTLKVYTSIIIEVYEDGNNGANIKTRLTNNFKNKICNQIYSFVFF